VSLCVFHCAASIIGIGSASGLIYKDNSLQIIGDSGYLSISMDSHDLKRHPLLEKSTRKHAQKTKQILEAITHFGDSLYIFWFRFH
jgi:hypothetical protein